MKIKVIASVLVFLVAGCVSAPTGQGSRLLPWNWFHPDATARVEQASAREDKASAAAVHAAHLETRKAELALSGAAESLPVATARRFLGNANGLLTQVGPITATDDAEARKIVSGLLSGSAEFVAAAEKAQLSAEGSAVKLSKELSAASAALEAAQGKLATANTENATQAAKYRRLWFWIWCIVGGWFALQLLAGIARFYPTFGPIARVAGFLSAPAVQASYERVTHGISAAIVAAEKVGAGVADNLRSHLDGPLDAAEKLVIRAKVEGANKKADPV